MSTIARKPGVSIKDGITSIAHEVASSFDARFLGLAALMPVLDVFRRISFSLPIALSGQASPDTCIACLATGLLAALIGSLVISIRGRHMQNLTRTLMGPLCGLMGMACMLPCALAMDTAPSALVPCGYLLLGGGIGLMLLGWIEVLTANSALINLVYVSTSVLVGNGLIFAVIALDTPVTLWALLTLCLAVSSSLLIWLKKNHIAQANHSDAPNEEAPDALADELGIFSVIRSSLTAPATGLALGVFSWGVMAVPPMPYVNDHKAWVYLVGNLAALGVILALMYTLRDGARYSAMRQKMFFLLPVFAVFMSYFSFIRMLDAEGGLKNFLSVGYNMSMAGFFTLFAVSAAAQSREKGLDIRTVAAPALIACTLSYSLGATLYTIYGNTAMYFQIVFTTLYILGLAFISSRRASLNDDSQLEERCVATGRKFGLSQREDEVLRLTVAGYSPVRIAEELTISPETVRTHKKRIYAKLEVHSHDELMRLVRTGKK